METVDEEFLEATTDFIRRKHAEGSPFFVRLHNLLDELGISANTIMVYTADNGPHYNEWPESGITPFRGEKTPTGKGHSVFDSMAQQDQSRIEVQRDRAAHRLGARD